MAYEESAEKKSKKRKKHKKKKDKKKKSKKSKRKRKEASQYDDDESKKHKVTNEGVKEPPSEDSINSKSNPVRVAVLGLPVGMTPINPPKKQKSAAMKPQAEEGSVAELVAGQDTRGEDDESLDYNTGNNIFESTTKVNIFEATPTAPVSYAAKKSNSDEEEMSPDSVAHYLNERPKDRAMNERPQLNIAESTKKHLSYPQTPAPNQYNRDDKVNPPQGSALEALPIDGLDKSHDYDPDDSVPRHHKLYSLENKEEQHENSEKECTYLSSYVDLLAQELQETQSPLSLLASENFLESYGETVAELASGRWQKTLSEPDKKLTADIPQGIVVCDNPLVDLTGADIELSDDSAIIVQRLSSWVESAQSKAFVRRLVTLAGSGRYNAIHVILCLDVELTSELSTDIATLQNAVFQQNGCQCVATFEYVAPRTLAASIAVRSASVCTTKESSNIADIVSEEQERARFLLMLVPSMTVHMALRCLGYSSDSNVVVDSGEAMQHLFEMIKNTNRDLLPFKLEGMGLSRVAEQLWMALHADMSHAYGG